MRQADASSPAFQVPERNREAAEPPYRHHVVETCQVCKHRPLEPVLFLGYHVPVNRMRALTEPLQEEPVFPTQLLICPSCQLAQIGFIVDQRLLFPPKYPYTTGTTQSLRSHFANLAAEVVRSLGLERGDLVIDIGSNDGTLLSNFAKAGHRVLGIEPTLNAQVANERGIPSLMAFFTPAVAAKVWQAHGPARIVTATNVFAHMPDIDEILEGITTLLGDDGVFISESHYFGDLVSTLQYDTIYHEHLRYYSLRSLSVLLQRHGYRVFRVQRIPTHGGSIRVYASRNAVCQLDGSVEATLAEERDLSAGNPRLAEFRQRVLQSKLALLALLEGIKRAGKRVVGIGAPSRASTLINYVGLDEGALDCVFEVKGSSKIGRCMPGTMIPVRDEELLYREQPDYAMILSWHIAEELAPALKRRGYQGDFILPLPTPRLLPGREVP
ncbi:MAG: class I SAM-dependent methyltransferase [Candidatus Omnitrophica bacterium]|nr:class I SAM-dependent methyltransferase [Candidatus Omnitrophota bacterium]